MEKAELIESIKTNTRALTDMLNRSTELAVSKVADDSATIENLDMMNMALEQLRIAAEQLEIGASRLHEIEEKVA
jgi:hypothetical protein